MGNTHITSRSTQAGAVPHAVAAHETDISSQPASPVSLKHLKSLAHHLNALIIVGQQGVSENVLQQIDGRIRDHELVKIKVAIQDRVERKQAIAQICARLSLQLVQSVGKTATLYRQAQDGEGKHSKVQR